MASRFRDNGWFTIQDQSAVGEQEVDLLDSFEAQRDARVIQPASLPCFTSSSIWFADRISAYTRKSHPHFFTPHLLSSHLSPQQDKGRVCDFIWNSSDNLAESGTWRSPFYRGDMIRRAAVKDAGRQQNINGPYPRIHYHFPYPCQARTFGLVGSTPLLI